MPLTAQEGQLRGRLAAHASWANTENRAARTLKARQALEDKFLAQAGGDPQRPQRASAAAVGGRVGSGRADHCPSLRLSGRESRWWTTVLMLTRRNA